MNGPMGATFYRFVAGQVRDGDGYIDGTCNFYALVEADDSARRRLAVYQTSRATSRGAGAWSDPADNKGWCCSPRSPTRSWASPASTARSGGTRSRPASSGPRAGWRWQAQVLLVDGRRARRASGAGVSTARTGAGPHDGPQLALARAAGVRRGCGASTPPPPGGGHGADRRSRARHRLPADDPTARGHDAPPEGDAGAAGPAGRDRSPLVPERYLPRANTLVPGRDSLVAGSAPAIGYTHAWKFLPEGRLVASGPLQPTLASTTRSTRARSTTRSPPAAAADARALAEAGRGRLGPRRDALSR